MPTTVPDPVVDWTAVMRAADPLHPPTRARYRHLLSRAVTSQGVVAPAKGDKRGLGGKRKFHSVLAVLAARAERAGDDEGARHLSDAATAVETRFSEQLTDFFLHHAPEELPKADFFFPLVEATRNALDEWGRLDTLLFGSGLVTETSDTDAHVWVSRLHGNPTDMLIPRELTEAQGIGPGASVWVFRTIVGSASVVDVLPALDINFDSGDTVLALELDDDYEARLLAEYEAGPGRMPSPEEQAGIVERAQARGSRRISLIG